MTEGVQARQLTTPSVAALRSRSAFTLNLIQLTPALSIRRSLYWHEHRSALVLDQEHQEFSRLGTACVPVNDMNIVGAFIEGLSWCQCYLFSPFTCITTEPSST